MSTLIAPQLSNIMNRARRYCASPSTQQLTDQEVIDAINTFYLWDMPSQLKLLSLELTRTIFTEPNVDGYDFDTKKYFAMVMDMENDRFRNNK